MRIIKYDLFPEAYGSNGMFLTKEGTVANLIIDTGMLLNSDFDKVIPNLDTLNKMFMQGNYPRAGEWEPFKIIVDCQLLLGSPALLVKKDLLFSKLIRVS